MNKNSLGGKAIAMRSISYIFLIFFLALPSAGFAMNSANYRIDSDVLGVFGNDSSSSNYNLSDTGGEEGIGSFSSANYDSKIGFWQAQEANASISIECPNNVELGSINGNGKSDLASNVASCVIITDNPGGYSLEWQASTADMISGTDAIAQYTSSSPEVWSVASTDSEWGARLMKTGTTTYDSSKWGAAAVSETYSNSDVLWYKVDNTAPYEIVRRISRTDVAGDTENILFGSEVGADKFQPSGIYSVGVTITATML